MVTWLRFSILALIWSAYYLAMHIAGGLLPPLDIVVCGCVIAACIAIMVVYAIKIRKGR